ncbi:MAG: hypothetical protein ACKOF7_03550, partial [Phycisphaerales bacterium]
VRLFNMQATGATLADQRLDTVAGERLMMGLRLVEGLPETEVAEILLLGARGPARRAAIGRAISGGMLERSAGELRFTARGMMTANATLSQRV